MEVALGDKEHQRERGQQAPQVESSLTRLADDEEDESCVDDVVGGGHAAIIARPLPRVVGAGVELRVDSQLNPGCAEPAAAGLREYRCSRRIERTAVWFKYRPVLPTALGSRSWTMHDRDGALASA